MHILMLWGDELSLVVMPTSRKSLYTDIKYCARLDAIPYLSKAVTFHEEFNGKIIWQFPIYMYIISKFMNLMTITHKNKSNWHVLWGQSQQHLSHRYWGWSKRSRQQVFTILIYMLTLKTSSAIELIPASFKAVIIAPTVAFLLAISWNKSKLIFLTTAFARNEQKTLEKICEPWTARLVGSG